MKENTMKVFTEEDWAYLLKEYIELYCEDEHTLLSVLNLDDNRATLMISFAKMQQEFAGVNWSADDADWDSTVNFYAMTIAMQMLDNYFKAIDADVFLDREIAARHMFENVWGEDVPEGAAIYRPQ